MQAREIHYINASDGLAAVMIKQNGNETLYFAETDNLGSIIGLLNPNGTYAERFSYDPWGRRRNPTNWSYNNVPAPTLIDRGFTGHEHLEVFGLINMDGRIYDPVLGRFLSVDPVIQSPDYSQSFNGYSYCFNNPLKYNDPSGYNAVDKGPGDIATAYLNAKQAGYLGSYNDFVSQFLNQYFEINDYLPAGGGGSAAMTFSWHEWGAQYTSYSGDFPVEVGCLRIDKSVTINVLFNPGKKIPNYTNRIGGLDQAGYFVDMNGNAAELTIQTRYKYGQRVNGVRKSAAQLTKENAVIWGKVAKGVNGVGGVIGVFDSFMQANDDISNGNFGLGSYEAAKGLGYLMGTALLFSPFAPIGFSMLFVTNIVDIAGDVGLYIYGKNK